jgi:pyruvate formate lyase activating enzyme
LCPRSCLLKDGERGFCFGRRNSGGELFLETYGRASGFAIDPIEKKPLYHFLPGTTVFSFGTIGCNLGCQFCQNWHISKSRQEDQLSVEASPEAIARKAKALGVPSVAFTYNEPVVFAEYVIDTAMACHVQGLRTVAVTAGYISPEARPEFFRNIDAANVDLKSFSEDFYHRMCNARLDPVLETLLYLKRETSVWLEITNLVIPGANDDLGLIRRMSDWIFKNLGQDVPLHFSAFHPDFHLQDPQPTPVATLQAARSVAMEAGLRYVYTGNVQDAVGSLTFCPSCGRPVIERDGFSIKDSHMNGNRCNECGAEIAGVFL